MFCYLNMDLAKSYFHRVTDFLILQFTVLLMINARIQPETINNISSTKIVQDTQELLFVAVCKI